MKWFLLGGLLVASFSYAYAGDLPDTAKTPGVANPALSKDVICKKGWSTKSVRNVDTRTKHKVYAEYGMNPKKKPCPCEVDHLIPLEAGGANDIKNLWPQSYVTQPYNAHKKDDLENQLHVLICAGKLDEGTAQHDIATNWIDAYQKYGGKPYRAPAKKKRK